MIKRTLYSHEQSVTLTLEPDEQMHLEHYVAGTFTQHDVTIYLAEGARLEHRIYVDPCVQGAMRLTLHCARYAQALVHSAISLADTSSLTVSCAQVHDHPDASSAVTFKVVLDDAAQWSFDGAIRIGVGAHGVAAELSNPCLILAHGKVRSEPVIEVLANNVSCKHGAASGRLDEDALQYLQHRGFDRPQARNLLVEAFLR